MRIEWADSSDRHGIDHADVINAILNAYYHRPNFDTPRVPGGARPDLFIGPPRNHIPGEPLIEVMLVRSSDTLFIFHAMEARPKMLDLFK